MVKKIIWSLSLVCFTMSTMLSLVGIISRIQIYFHVSFTVASIFASIFAGVLGVSSLITPALFSRFEKKKIIMIILFVTALCNLIEMFITNYFVGLIFRVIPAILYPIAISAALTIIGKIDPDNTNKVVLGISAGSILGLSITTYLGFNFGYQWTMLWFCLINSIALIATILFIPNFEGNKEPVIVQIGHAKSKLFLYSIIYVLFMIIGISITYNHIPTYLSRVTEINGEMLFFTLFLMGLISIIGTSLSGYAIKRDAKKAVFFYPVGFAIVMFILNLFVEIPFYEFLALMLFSIFDGSAYTVSQYWVTSSVRQSPEFANGIFLLMCNLAIFIGTVIGGIIIDNTYINYIFIGSIIMMVLAIPFVLIRIQTYPNAV